MRPATPCSTTGSQRPEIEAQPLLDLGEPWCDFLQRLQPELRRMLYRFRIPQQDREDIVQESLLLLLGKQHLDEPAAYLMAVVRNRCLMYWRKVYGRHDEPTEIEHIEAVAGGQRPEQDQVELRCDLNRLLRDLPPRNQELLQRYYRYGYTFSELAADSGDLARNLKQRCYHARLRARDLARHLDDPRA